MQQKYFWRDENLHRCLKVGKPERHKRGQRQGQMGIFCSAMATRKALKVPEIILDQSSSNSISSPRKKN